MTRTLALALMALVLAAAAGGAAPTPTFTLPYDIEPAPNGDLFIGDGNSGRVLRYVARTRTLRLVTKLPSTEVTSIARTPAGVLYVGEIQSGVIWRVDTKGRRIRFASVPAPAESVLHGSTLYVASLEGGIVAIDLNTRQQRTFPMDPGPHGLDVDAAGNVYAARRDIVKLDPRTGELSVVSPHDAFKPLIAPDGTVYYVAGSPTGSYVNRVEDAGRVTRIAGTNRIGNVREGMRAVAAPMQISDIEWARDGSLLIAQTQPRPARIWRIDRSGRLRTVVRSPR